MDIWLSEEQHPQLTADLIAGKDAWVVARIVTEGDSMAPEHTLEISEVIQPHLLPVVVAAAQGERLLRPKKPREVESEPFTEADFEGCAPVGLLEFIEASRTYAIYSDEMAHRKMGSRLWTTLTKHVRAEHENSSACDCSLAWYGTQGGGVAYDLQGLARMYFAIKEGSAKVYGISGKSMSLIRQALINALDMKAQSATGTPGL